MLKLESATCGIRSVAGRTAWIASFAWADWWCQRGTLFTSDWSNWE